jgi:fructokinase
VRAHLWADPGDLRALCLRALPYCDVVKVSDDESEAVLGETDPRRAARKLRDLGVQLACITLGPKGALVQRGDEELVVEAPRVEVVDTTGAGDGFMAGLLSVLAHPRTAPLEDLAKEQLLRGLRLGCAIGSRVCTRLGAVAGLPNRAQLASEGLDAESEPG